MRMHLVDHCDVSGIHSLESLLRMVRQRGGDVYMDGVRQPVMETMQSTGFDQLLGRDHFLERGESISYIFHRVMEPSICIYECPVRVFAECQALPKWEYGTKVLEATSLPEYDIPTWHPSDLKEHLPPTGIPLDFILIDVREPKEFRQGHVPHAQLMPIRTIPQKGNELPRDQTIVVICRIGRRSRLAAGILKDMGYDRVFNL
jgi:SulP family sulfate permease